MPDKTRGMYEKFTVSRTDGQSAAGSKHFGCSYFVLDVTCDPHAIPALMAYAQSCIHEYPKLAADIITMAIAHCEHDWGDTLFGPDAIGQHCVRCGVDKGEPEEDFDA